jgi:thymidine kinase
MKPCADTRDGNVIKSRAMNTELFAIPLSENDNPLYKAENYIAAQEAAGRPPIKWILVDEAQFLTPGQVDQLARIVDELDVNVICYGLRTDFRQQLFPGSKRLFEVADKFEEMRSTCRCGNRADVNVRYNKDGSVVIEGPQVECGSEDKYITLCRKCYKQALHDGHI